MLDGGRLLADSLARGQMLNPGAGPGAGMDVVRRRARSPRPQRPQEIYNGAVKDLQEAEKVARQSAADHRGGKAASREPSPQRKKSAEGLPRASLTKLKNEGWGGAALRAAAPTARRPSTETDPLSVPLRKVNGKEEPHEDGGGHQGRERPPSRERTSRRTVEASAQQQKQQQQQQQPVRVSSNRQASTSEREGAGAGLAVTGEATGQAPSVRRVTSAPASPKSAEAGVAAAVAADGGAPRHPPSSSRSPSAGPSRLRYQNNAGAVPVPRPPQVSPPSSDVSSSREHFRRSKFVRERAAEPGIAEGGVEEGGGPAPHPPPRLRLNQPPPFPRPTSASSDLMAPSPKAAPASRPAQFLVDAVRSKDEARLASVLGNLRGGSPRGPVIGINDPHPVTGRTALHEAVALGRLGLVEALLQAGADTGVGHATQGPPLLHAAAWGEAEIVAALLQAGAELEARDCAAYTALHYAAVGGHVQTAVVLLRAGADVEARNEDGQTAREMASGERMVATLSKGRAATPDSGRVGEVGGEEVRTVASFEIPESWKKPPPPPASAFPSPPLSTAPVPPPAGAAAGSGRPRSGRRLTGGGEGAATVAQVTSPSSEDLSPPPRLRLPAREKPNGELGQGEHPGGAAEEDEAAAPPLPRCASPDSSPTSGSASSVGFSPFSANSAATPPTGNETPKLGAMLGAGGNSPFIELVGPPGSGGLAGHQHLRGMGNFRPGSGGHTSRGIGSPMARETANRVASGLGVNSTALQHQAAQMFYQSVEVITGDISWTRGELLGEGAYGKVYAGLNQLTGELMAVKVLPLEVGNGLNTEEQRAHLQSLEHELSLYRRFQHRHIVGYIAAHMDYKTNTMYMFLEYVPGGSIAQMLERFSAFTEDLTRNFTRQLLLGLEYLHGCKVIHRDLKGGNVLVTRDGRVKLADFGASKAYHEATITDGMKSIRGSVFWMAPEVIKGTGYGRRADIWSAGCTVIEMLTGKHPWPELGDSHWSAMFQIAKTTTGPPIPDSISPIARDFLALCFRIDPQLRPTVSDLLQHPFVAHIPNAFRAAEEAVDLNHSL